jgi:hypothetical protein
MEFVKKDTINLPKACETCKNYSCDHNMNFEQFQKKESKTGNPKNAHGYL